MRTKALILSGLLGLLGATTSSTMAQTNVYSLNAVGYINVVCPVGFSIIANQLNSTNNNITNLFPNGVNSNPNPTAAGQGYGAYDFCTIFIFQTNGNYTVFNGDSGDPANNNCGWSGPTGTSAGIIPPGAGFWFLNNQFAGGTFSSNTSITNTFVGTVMQGSLTNELNPGFNMVGSVVPQTGGIGTVLGLVPTGIQDGQYDGGDTIFMYINQHYVIYNEDDGYTTPPATPLYWDGPVSNAIAPANFTSVSGGTYNDPNLPQNQVGTTEIEPIVSVGQGFWYYVTKGKPALAWTRTFSVNN